MVFFTQWSASYKTQNTVNPLSGPQLQRHRLASVHFIHLDWRIEISIQNSHDIFQCTRKGGKWRLTRCLIEHHNMKTPTREWWYTSKKFYPRK